MDGFDRIYDLHRILKGRKSAISLPDILSEMECSRATFNRIKKHMVDFLGAPIEYDRELGGYVYREGKEQGYELPGLWFSETDLHALLMMQSLISHLGVGLLKDELAAIEKHFNRLLQKHAVDPCVLRSKVRYLGIAIRPVESRCFLEVVDATFKESSLHIHYESRGEGAYSSRDISPQRVIYYRNNWYLDAWCHLRQDFRTFAMECILDTQPSSEKYKPIPEQELNPYFEKTYGICSGGSPCMVKLCFYGATARRVAKEVWHPLQKVTRRDDSALEMVLPVNRELPDEFIMDVMKLGDGVEIIEPAWLRETFKEKLTAALKLYGA